MIFETEAYFKLNNITGFYPEVEIQFAVLDDKHYLKALKLLKPNLK